MNKRMIAPILFGIVGITILVLLGNWQVRRLAWKQDMLANIEARLTAPAIDLPDILDPARDRFLSVKVTGQMVGAEIHVLSSDPSTGAGYRIITAFVTDSGRRILIDRGIVPEAKKDADRVPENGVIYGNLLWANDTDKYTPEANLTRNIWFSRAEGPLAEALNTEPIFLVQSSTTLSNGPIPIPVGLNTPNNHLEYAVTWYGFAIVWLGMTLYLLWRIKRRTI
ncbi:MAG: SURF1 family protein [Rhodobacteraceae bacterium]|nr:SURF1 family protein [Paracoccaceae bacterium]